MVNEIVKIEISVKALEKFFIAVENRKLSARAAFESVMVFQTK